MSNKGNTKMYLYSKALSWVILVSCFTYTAILVAFAQKGVDVNGIYCSNQKSIAALLVNIGLVAMVFFDFFSTGRQIKNNYFFMMFIGIFLSIATYGHSAIAASGQLGNYYSPLSWKWAGAVLHLVFLSILVVLKERAYEMDILEEPKAFIRKNKEL